jgi:hypothetical protein
LLSIQVSYDQDEVAQGLIDKLALDPATVPHYTPKDGILRYKRRIWVGAIPALQHQLIVAVHASTLGDHSSFLVTYRRLKNMFAWKGMKADVHNFVQSCQVYLQAKLDRSSYPGKL